MKCGRDCCLERSRIQSLGLWATRSFVQCFSFPFHPSLPLILHLNFVSAKEKNLLSRCSPSLPRSADHFQLCSNITGQSLAGGETRLPSHQEKKTVHAMGRLQWQIVKLSHGGLLLVCDVLSQSFVRSCQRSCVVQTHTKPASSRESRLVVPQLSQQCKMMLPHSRRHCSPTHGGGVELWANMSSLSVI